MSYKEKFKPSDIKLNISIALPNTFDKAELEQAASLLLFILQKENEGWNPVNWNLVEKYCNDYQFVKIFSNPFFKPNFAGLVLNKFAEYNITNDSYEFTELGLEKIYNKKDTY